MSPQRGAIAADLAAPSSSRAPSGRFRGVSVMHVVAVPMSLVFLRGQLAALRAQGASVAIACGKGADLHAVAEQEGVRAIQIGFVRPISLVADLRALRALAVAILRVRPDIVHAHTPKAGLLGMLAARVARVPVRIYHLRGLPLQTATGLRRRLLTWTERVSCGLAHRVICVSHSLREMALAEGLCDPARIMVIAGGSGQGVDAAERFDPERLPEGTRAATRRAHGIPRDALVIGFVGRVVRDKGVVELWEAWSRLRSALPQARLLVVGPFERGDPLPADTAAALTSDPRVHVVGEQADTPAFYAAMDVVALPTHREGFPNVLLEAAAMRLPVVATRIPGCVDAVEEGVTGTLVPPHDVSALAAALLRYARDADLRFAHGAAARTRVQRDFRRELIWEGVFAQYDELLARRGTAAESG